MECKRSLTLATTRGQPRNSVDRDLGIKSDLRRPPLSRNTVPQLLSQRHSSQKQISKAALQRRSPKAGFKTGLTSNPQTASSSLMWIRAPRSPSILTLNRLDTLMPPIPEVPPFNRFRWRGLATPPSFAASRRPSFSWSCILPTRFDA